MVTLTTRKTKTWPGRHENKISRLIEKLKLWNIRDPIVLEIGPGGIAEEYLNQLPIGPEDGMSWKDRKKLQLASIREARARDRPDVNLATSETLELYHALLGSVGLSEMYVVDKEPKVLDAVRKLGLPKVVVFEHDISVGPVYYPSAPLKADITVAWKVLEYLRKRYNAGLASIMNSTKQDRGILSLTLPKRRAELVPPGLTLLAENVYLNGERTDKRHNISLGRPELDVEAIERAAHTRHYR